MAEKQFSGVMLGAMSNENGLTAIGINVNGSLAVVSIGYAGLIFSQLGDLLDSLGYFEDEEKANAIQEGETCKMKH